MISSFLYKTGAHWAVRLPRGLCEWFTRLLADMYYLARPGRRRAVRGNLRAIHGDTLSRRQMRRLARRVFRNFARSILFFLQLPRMDIEEFKQARGNEDFKNLAEGLSREGGFIIVTAHLGPWEMGGVWLAVNDLKVNTVALNHPARAVTKFFNQRRELSGLKIHSPRGSFDVLLAALERGECVALLVDRDYGAAGLDAGWFGTPQRMPIGHLLLAHRAQVPLLTGAFVFNPGGGFRYVVKGVYRPEPELGESEMIERMQKKVLSDLEELVRTYSDQWFQFFPLARGRH
jgi:KDO2-lipid IV(A) lauroyltransferase